MSTVYHSILYIIVQILLKNTRNKIFISEKQLYTGFHIL